MISEFVTRYPHENPKSALVSGLFSEKRMGCGEVAGHFRGSLVGHGGYLSRKRIWSDGKA